MSGKTFYGALCYYITRLKDASVLTPTPDSARFNHALSQNAHTITPPQGGQVPYRHPYDLAELASVGQ
ncbi:MAG: hypothetical protein AseanaTS_11580 [Candidatus Pelagadaptatus aseana]